MCLARISSPAPTRAANSSADHGRERPPARRHREHGAEGEREGRRRVARGPRGDAETGAPVAGVAVFEQRLEHLGGERGRGEHDRYRERHPRAGSRQRQRHQSHPPEDVQGRVEQVQDRAQDLVQVGAAEAYEVAQQDAVADVDRRHQLGQAPHQRERHRTAGGEQQRPRRARRGVSRETGTGAARTGAVAA